MSGDTDLMLGSGKMMVSVGSATVGAGLEALLGLFLEALLGLLGVISRISTLSLILTLLLLR